MNKISSKDQLKVLLENTSQEVRSILLNSSQQTNKYYYENFTSVSLKGLRYIGQYINLISKDQDISKIIDHLIQDFTNSLKEYKARNIYIHSTHLQEEQSNYEDDEIYHFMNTRNNLLAVECISNYENQKQRKELQEFVEEISRKKLPPKESKRSLLLPKDNSFNLKIGRKTTFDPDIFLHEAQESTPAQYIPFPVISQTVEIQTEAIEEEHDKKSEVEAFSQCQSLLPSQGTTLQNISTSKLKISNSLKKKEKKKLPNEDLKKKKTKFQPTNHSDKNRYKGSKQKKDTQCSLKLVKINEPCLSLHSKEIDIIVNKSEEVSTAKDHQDSDHSSEIIPVIHGSSEETTPNNNQSLSKKPSNEGEECKQIDHVIEQSVSLSKHESIKSSKSDQHLQGGTNSNKKHLMIKANSLLYSQSQKIPTSGIRILESSTTDNESNAPNKEGQAKTIQARFGCMKKKRFTGDRHLFQSCHLTEGLSEKLNASTHLRASKIMITPQLSKKTSSELEKKENESYASTPSQDYLASRQEQKTISIMGKSEQNALQPMRISRRSLETCIKEINLNDGRSSILQNDFSNKTQNSDRMIIISNQQNNNGASLKQSSAIFQNNALQSNIKANVLGKGSSTKHSFLKRNHLTSISEAKGTEDSSRLLMSKLREGKGNKAVDLSPNESNKSKFYRLSSQKAASLPKFYQTTSLITPKDGQTRYGESSSCHSSSFQLGQVKRTLRNRASKVKLEHYLQLVQTMHQKLCGADCQHIKEIKQAKQGDVGEQLIRLLTRQK